VSWQTNLQRLGLFGLACGAYGTFIENQAFKLRRFTVPVLPKGAPALRLLHISDLHLLCRNKARRRFLSGLAGLEPDIVVNTGDNVAEPSAIEALRESLGRLLDAPGVFVHGSADYEAPVFRNPLGYIFSPTTRELDLVRQRPVPTAELEAMLTSGGWRDVNEHRAVIDVLGLRLEFRGTNDAHLGLDDYAAVAGPASDGVDASIGVTHAPYRRILDAMARDKVKLILAGHTHGGQVCVPGFGALTTNCDLDPKRAKGLWRYSSGGHKSWLHVSAGLGTSPFAPFRFACPPEASLLTLVGKGQR
jgi:predicted MPP superfamily phosphohydrolase